MAVILLSRALLSNLVHIYYANQSKLNMAIFTGCFVIGEAPLHISWVSQLSYRDCHPFQQTGNRVLLIALRNLYNRVGILTQLFYCQICVLAITSDLSNCLPPQSCSSTQKIEQLFFPMLEAQPFAFSSTQVFSHSKMISLMTSQV